MRSKVVSLQVGNFHVGKSWRLESERFTCLREGGGIMLGTTRYVGAPQHMLGSTIFVGAPLHMLGHQYIYMSKGVREIMLGTTICVGAPLHMLRQHDISTCLWVSMYMIMCIYGYLYDCMVMCILV